MRKFFVLVIALISFGVFSSVANATTSDSCVAYGRGHNICFAQTAEQRVALGQIILGRYSYGLYTFTCTKGHNTFIKTGRIFRGGSRMFNPETLFGVKDPNCVLTTRALAYHGHTARVRLFLFT